MWLVWTSVRLWVLVLGWIVAVFTMAAPEKPAKLMVLGTIHLHNPGRDIHNLNVDDVLSPKRQKEIGDLVARLQAFKPTKIAVELKPGSDNPGTQKILASYKNYLEHRGLTQRNEIYQIAFPLGKALGHPRLYPVDAGYPFPYEALLKQAKALGTMPILDAADEAGAVADQREALLLKQSTITHFFRELNQPAALLANHRWYIDAALRIGDGQHHAGADLVRDWYARNLRIFKNILALRDSGDTRLLVLIGAGHAHILKQLARDSAFFELVEPNDYL